MRRDTTRQGQSQGQEQDEDFVDYDERGDVVAAVFQALRRHAPSTLRALQACPMDAAAVIDWARTHSLERFLPLVREAMRVRTEWERQPPIAHPRSSVRAVGITFRSYERRYQVWAARLLPPDPALETLQQWRKRADAMYRAAGALSPPRPRQWVALSTHAAWFVRTHVLDASVDSLAASDVADVTTIQKAIARVSAALREPAKNLPD